MGTCRFPLRRLLLTLACVTWVMFVTFVMIVMDDFIRSCDMAPRSTLIRLLGGYDRGLISSYGGISLLAWAWERILMAHLLLYLAWRGFKAVFLR